MSDRTAVVQAAILAFVLGFLVVAAVVGPGQFLVKAYQHGGL